MDQGVIVSKFFCIGFLFLASVTWAESLDKIAAIIDDHVIMASEVNRIVQTLPKRRNISTLLYPKTSYTFKEATILLVQQQLIRNQLDQVGRPVTDDEVESQIQMTEKRLGIGRSSLLAFLKKETLTFEEYFEIIRSTIEINIFQAKVIAPLISLSEQDLKDAWGKNGADESTTAFKYDLIDFSIPKKQLPPSSKMVAFKAALIQFMADGSLPKEYQDIEASPINDVAASGLEKSIGGALHKTPEGAFTRPILLQRKYHLFFIKKKMMATSDAFEKSKDRLRVELFDEAAAQVSDIWFRRESDKHYIKYY
jgi:peptidyl-prolyl cis-trans isomerase SurA